MVIVNQSTEHPSCPEQPKNQRVSDYWSYMVIKPKTTFRKEGLEFVVTYFDNPGIVMPPTVTKWVSRIYMPDFLSKLHQATLRYATGKDLLLQDERFNDDAEEVAEEEDFFWNYTPDPGYEYPPERAVHHSAQNGVRKGGGGSIKRHSGGDRQQSESADQEDGHRREQRESETEVRAATGGGEGEKTTTAGRTSWWSYLHPYSYFV